MWILGPLPFLTTLASTLAPATKGAQKKLEQSIFTGTAGGGMVKVEATGDKRIVNIEIDSDVLNPEDKEMIQDTIVAAINDVMRKIDEETQDVMGAFTGGMGMPGLF